jgi:hypothetical protein
LNSVTVLSGTGAKPTEATQYITDKIATDQGCVPGSGGGSIIGYADAMLPMTVKNWFTASSYMGDGAGPQALYPSPPPPCLNRAHSEAVGNCHRFEYRPGAEGRTGVFWQQPADNWGDAGELAIIIPVGAQSIQFCAWSDTPDTVVKFMAGLRTSIDGFTTKIVNISLSTEPTEYTLDPGNASYSDVVAAFNWYADVMPDVTIVHVDDHHYSKAPTLKIYEEPELALPLSVQTWFSASGYLSDGEDT